MKDAQTMLKLLRGTIFNCYYTVTDPVSAAQYNKSFSIEVILWNILFNVGYMYTDSKKLINFFYYDSAVTTPLWATFGKYLGDFFVRFIYSKFIPKTYYNF